MANLLDKASILLTPTAYDNGSMLSVKPTNGDGDFTFSRNGDASRVNSSGNIVTEGANLPRINYENGCGSWLLEDESTNFINYSEDFSQWNKSGISIISNIIASPSGDVNATKIVESSLNEVHRIVLGTVVAGNQYTISVFAKAAERSFLSFGGIGLYGNGEFVQYDLINGTAINTGTTNNASVDIKHYGNGWYRCTATYIATGSSGFLISILDQLYSGNSSSSAGQSYQGDGTSGVYIWGAQLEQQSYATSYIPTSGASSTRLRDLATGSGNSTLINSTEGTLYFEGSAFVNGGVNRYISISDNTSSNRLQFVFTSITNRLQVSGTITPTSINYNSFIQTDNNKIAISYSALGVNVYVNGSLVGSNTDDASSPTNTFTALDFSLWNKTSALFQGKVKAIAVYKEALTDAELTALTTI